MGAIVDVLLLGPEDIPVVKKKYPGCVLQRITDPLLIAQRYRLIATSEDLGDDSYYNFLLDNQIALSSTSFKSRLESDRTFVERIKARTSAAQARERR